MEKIQALKGTYDILPEEAAVWRYLEGIIRETCETYGFGEIRVPVFEYTKLFARGVGDTTDVVQKEMYTFEDKGGRSVTLRPEGTSGVVRSALEHSLLAGALPVKLFYILTCYRNEKPQAGRYREFRQFGVETFGSMDSSLDAEIISLAVNFLNKVGLKDIRVNINSIGCPKCRKKYNEALRDYLRGHLGELCATCNSRFEKNPMRIIDCKEEKCKEIGKGAPNLLEYICEECAEHFEGVKKSLDALEIQYMVDPTIVRGLDYYTKTVFEIKSGYLGAQSTICGGGRYDGLVEELGGKPTPGVGFGLGLERLIICLEAQGTKVPEPRQPELFVCVLGDAAKNYALSLVNRMRKLGIYAERDCMNRGLKAQMKYADKIKAKYTVAIGDNEIESGICGLKKMETGTVKQMRMEEIEKYLQSGKDE